MFKILILAIALATSSPSLDIERVERSVARFTSSKGSCTAFAINLYTYVSAHHCLEGDDYRIDGVEVTIVKRDAKADLILVSCGACQMRPGLSIAKRDPKLGEWVTGIGYAGPIEQYPLFETGQVVRMTAEFDWLKHPIMLTNTNWIAGQSGGPIVNQAGDVVGVIVGGFNEGTMLENYGGAIRLDELRKFLK